uniref:Uncharacterized protein n=1 Tax=Romanomermis culicivorax TaxID=13658 RepID=A0A915JRN4_ROMCU
MQLYYNEVHIDSIFDDEWYSIFNNNSLKAYKTCSKSSTRTRSRSSEIRGLKTQNFLGDARRVN